MQGEILSAAPLELAGIRFGSAAIAEIDSGRVMVEVKRADVTRMAICYGAQARHPLIQLIAGIVLVAIGIFPVWHVIRWVAHGGTLLLHEGWFFVPLRRSPL